MKKLQIVQPHTSSHGGQPSTEHEHPHHHGGAESHAHHHHHDHVESAAPRPDSNDAKVRGSQYWRSLDSALSRAETHEPWTEFAEAADVFEVPGAFDPLLRFIESALES